MFSALNRRFRRQRRRLVLVATMLTLAGIVVTAHTALTHDKMGDAAVMCLAVAGTAVAAVGTALAFGARMGRPRWPVAEPPLRHLVFLWTPAGVHARAGPPLLQVFRL